MLQDTQKQKAEEIYREAMASLDELEKNYQQVLASAKKRVEEERMRQIEQSLQLDSNK